MRHHAAEKVAENILRSEPPAPAQRDLFAAQGREPRYAVRLEPAAGYLVWDNLRQAPYVRRRRIPVLFQIRPGQPPGETSECLGGS
jgi:hypothetical protein